MRRRDEYVEDIAVMLGGYAAEKKFFGDITTGASSDMRQATRLARDMVTKWGMSDALGPRVYGEQADMIFLGREIHENRDYSEAIAEKIDKEIDALISGGLATANDIISSNTERIEKVAATLIEKETLERQEFYDAVGVAPANPKNIL